MREQNGLIPNYVYESKAIQKGLSLGYSINYFVTKVLNHVLKETSHVGNIFPNEISSHRLVHIKLKIM